MAAAQESSHWTLATCCIGIIMTELHWMQKFVIFFLSFFFSVWKTTEEENLIHQSTFNSQYPPRMFITSIRSFIYMKAAVH